MADLTIVIDSISGVLHDCFKRHRIASSVLHTTKGRISTFEFIIDDSIPVIKFVSMIEECNYEFVKYDKKNSTIKLKENNEIPLHIQNN